MTIRRRVSGCRAPTFDLDRFGQALQRRDVEYQIACYASDADIRLVDPDNPPSAARTVSGTTAIRTWLSDHDLRNTDFRVSRLVDAGDRVAFTQSWTQFDGRPVVAANTAELQDGLIATQHTIIAWA